MPWSRHCDARSAHRCRCRWQQLRCSAAFRPVVFVAAPAETSLHVIAAGRRSAQVARVDIGGGLAYWTVLDGPALAVVEEVDAYLPRHRRPPRATASMPTRRRTPAERPGHRRPGPALRTAGHPNQRPDPRPGHPSPRQRLPHHRPCPHPAADLAHRAHRPIGGPNSARRAQPGPAQCPLPVPRPATQPARHSARPHRTPEPARLHPPRQPGHRPHRSQPRSWPTPSASTGPPPPGGLDSATAIGPPTSIHQTIHPTAAADGRTTQQHLPPAGPRVARCCSRPGPSP
jgi:hypothetical protein